MSLRTRLFLSFAMLTLIAVSTALAGYVEFRKSLDQYQNLTAVLVPTYEAVSNLVDLSRFLSDQPMVYAFAETETDRADELARYRQAADDLTDWQTDTLTWTACLTRKPCGRQRKP